MQLLDKYAARLILFFACFFLDSDSSLPYIMFSISPAQTSSIITPVVPKRLSKEGATEHPHHKACSATILYEIVYTVDEQRHIELFISSKSAGNARLIY
jgi:hypothetical protein